MKKDRLHLEDKLNLILVEYANNAKVIDSVTKDLVKKGVPLGKASGLFTKVIPLSYISEVELCLFVKYLYKVTRENNIKPDNFFTETELLQVESHEFLQPEITDRIILHNVDQISDDQWLCSKESYQNISLFFQSGLINYNSNTQRQPKKRKVNDKIIEVININLKKITDIKNQMLNGTFFPNAIIFNIEKESGASVDYDAKNRTLTFKRASIIDGFHRMGGMIKSVEVSPEINRVTSIYVYNVTEDRARQIISQESKATPIYEKFIEKISTSNRNMEVAKTINTTQQKNEMFSRIGLDNNELRRENKLTTFDALSKTIQHVYDLQDKPFIVADNTAKFLIEVFNIVIGINYTAFNEDLFSTRSSSYLADNNTFIGYVALGEEVKKKYPDQWQEKLINILQNIDFTKPNDILKDAGLGNRVNLSTIKRISEYFKGLV